MKIMKALRKTSARNPLARRRNLNHAAHMLMTALTLGLWLPVWLVLCLRNEGWKSSHNWLLAGKASVGLARMDRLDMTPEMRSRLADR
ncbi:hypothetical protein V6C53_13250 [Desulfocurvibacter africanus]|uniref:Uncharacterized protein n=2 Tax=Desulfocurvibacter africanus TaxID=873 RepID=F3YZ67_DESAF|nr:hypothetical protein [Desulfocurvibacter africanus]EGJ50823.1 hypothetical protein Desaf_2500 [Desulfocurvibacter africanus subsp. africanus str. Walvis Bay]EMG36079.1 hypothetical protein PCS_03142 [Desulfocurvibacter africanus PCS]